MDEIRWSFLDLVRTLCVYSFCFSLQLLKQSDCASTDLNGWKHLQAALDSHNSPYGYRGGSPTKTHSCGEIRGVPSDLRLATAMKPKGVSIFYQKYTEAYGIPVLGSKEVDDQALRRACYVLRYFLADHSGIRQSFYKFYARVAVIGQHEKVTDIPAYSFLSSYWNSRSRGLGGTEWVPVTSGAGENLLCFGSSIDIYFNEDIFVHELTHGIHLTGAKYAIPDFQNKLEIAYSNAMKNGLWDSTYGQQNENEYLAEGVQSYFGVNVYRSTPDGIHGPINSKQQLKEYDPALHHLVTLMFPCGNSFLDRCNTTRARESEQVLKMDCDRTQEYDTQFVQKSTTTPIVDQCKDDNRHCPYWGQHGECDKNPGYMLVYCKKSCYVC